MESAFYQFAYGILEIKYKNDYVYNINLVENITKTNTPSLFSDLVFQELEEYLMGTRKKFTFQIKLIGTDFQKKVWQELIKIPYGETRTYKDIAIAIGNPNSARAVGSANNKNPLLIAVPCHRVIGSKGNLVGYVGGLYMKKSLLTIENKYNYYT